MKYLLLIVAVTLVSCSSLKYKSTTQEKLPELGTVGILKNRFQAKTVLHISNPIRVKLERTKLSERGIFSKKESVNLSGKDSTLITIEILDIIGLLKEINSDEELLKYLTKVSDHKLVSKVKMHFNDTTLKKLDSIDEIYLIQNKQSTLSLELRNASKLAGTIEFSDGEIVDFKTLEFCWGLGKRRELVIFDLVSVGNNCSKDTYKSARKTKKKTEFKF